MRNQLGRELFSLPSEDFVHILLPSLPRVVLNRTRGPIMLRNNFASSISGLTLDNYFGEVPDEGLAGEFLGELESFLSRRRRNGSLHSANSATGIYDGDRHSWGTDLSTPPVFSELAPFVPDAVCEALRASVILDWQIAGAFCTSLPIEP